MKKLSAILSLVLLVCLVSGCAGSPVIYYSDCTCPVDSHVQTPATQPQAPVVTEGAVKTGLAVVTSVAESVDGEAKYDVTIAAVNVDENGASTVSLYLPARTAMVLREGEIRKPVAEVRSEVHAAEEKSAPVKMTDKKAAR